MFICTGLTGSIVSLVCYHSRYIKMLEEKVE